MPSVRPVHSYSFMLPWFAMAVKRQTREPYIKLVKTVYRDFIKIQKMQKKHQINLPVIYVDTDIDRRIPFIPDKVSIYLGFIQYFVRPLSIFIKKMGLRKAAPICAAYISFVKSLYADAGSIYRCCLTTTHRPVYKEDKRFRFIYRNDPHYLCVPSLHICIVTGCYSFFREAFKRAGFSEAEQDTWNGELFDGASDIGESVLFVKQHSVNCIPAALYMMTILHSDLFSVYDATNYINSLFADDTTISKADRNDITGHISFMYERLLLEGAYCSDWRDPIRHWFKTYAEQTGQSLPALAD